MPTPTPDDVERLSTTMATAIALAFDLDRINPLLDESSNPDLIGVLGQVAQILLLPKTQTDLNLRQTMGNFAVVGEQVPNATSAERVGVVARQLESGGRRIAQMQQQAYDAVSNDELATLLSPEQKAFVLWMLQDQINLLWVRAKIVDILDGIVAHRALNPVPELPESHDQDTI